jgi:hypothetical protein
MKHHDNKKRRESIDHNNAQIESHIIDEFEKTEIKSIDLPDTKSELMNQIRNSSISALKKAFPSQRHTDNSVTPDNLMEQIKNQPQKLKSVSDRILKSKLEDVKTPRQMLLDSIVKGTQLKHVSDNTKVPDYEEVDMALALKNALKKRNDRMGEDNEISDESDTEWE